MPEQDILSPAGPFRIPEWARQGAGAFPQPSPGGGSPLPPQAAQTAQVAAPPPAGSTRPPTFRDAMLLTGLIPAPFIDLPGLQPMLNKPFMSAEQSAKLPPGFADEFATATPTGK